MDKPQSRTPLIVAIVLLLLPVLYVGSYLALVSPSEARADEVTYSNTGEHYSHGYRNGGNWAWRLFWPLEQIDRKVRPGAWEVTPLEPPFSFVPERTIKGGVLRDKPWP
jgi:hypothetical protein